MLLPRILLVAIVAAPLAWSPVPVSAQERGLARAQTRTAEAVAAPGLTNSHNQNQNRRTEVPRGISKKFGAEATLLPPGISRRFLPPAPTPYVDEEECEGWTFVVLPDGSFGVVDCDGNVVS